MSDTGIDWDPTTFTASAVYTGENRMAHVHGNGTAPSTGWTATIDYGDPGINPDADTIYLQITETEPDIKIPTLTPIEVDGDFDAPEGKTKVQIWGVGLVPITEMP